MTPRSFRRCDAAPIYLEALAACGEGRREVRLSDEENMPKLGVKNYQILCLRQKNKIFLKLVVHLRG